MFLYVCWRNRFLPVSVISSNVQHDDWEDFVCAGYFHRTKLHFALSVAARILYDRYQNDDRYQKEIKANYSALKPFADHISVPQLFIEGAIEVVRQDDGGRRFKTCLCWWMNRIK
jgi:glutaredoxin